MSDSGAASGSRLLGVVLAGGRSRRFGSPKALATFHGEALWARAVRTLGEAGLTPLVIANDDEVARAIEVEVRGDLRRDRGPLAGIESGLSAARELGLDGILVLACDLVLVDAPLLAELMRAWTGKAATAFESDGPWGVAPLCSIWGGDLLPTVSAALNDGRGSPGEMLLEVPLVQVTVPSGCDPATLFRSANRPEDLAELEALRSRG